MIPTSKDILNRKQKRAALVSCTLFAFMGLLASMPFLCPFSSVPFVQSSSFNNATYCLFVRFSSFILFKFVFHASLKLRTSCSDFYLFGVLLAAEKQQGYQYDEDYLL